MMMKPVDLEGAHDAVSVANALARVSVDGAFRAGCVRAARMDEAAHGGLWLAMRMAGGLVRRPDGLADDAFLGITGAHMNRESLTVARMRQAGLDAFCPIDERQKRKPRGKNSQKICVPMFANYGFVRIDGTVRAMLGVLSFDGVHGLVMNGARVAIIPDKIINEIKVFAACSPKQRRLMCGLVQVGDRVMITASTMRGMVAPVAAIDPKTGRVDLETMLFGATRRITLGLDDIVKAG